MLDVNPTLIHKDFAKSTAWQIIAFDFCVCLVLYGAMEFIGQTAWSFVQGTLGVLMAATFSVLGINIKKMNQIKKELKENET